jgi:hypothetical protein
VIEPQHAAGEAQLPGKSDGAQRQERARAPNNSAVSSKPMHASVIETP